MIISTNPENLTVIVCLLPFLPKIKFKKMLPNQDKPKSYRLSRTKLERERAGEMKLTYLWTVTLAFGNSSSRADRANTGQTVTMNKAHFTL